MFDRIKKRNGEIVRFEAQKITEAIYKAGQATGEFELEIAKKLTLRVLDLAIDIIGDKTPSVEEIQDIVEEVLISSPYKKTAKAYIIYRDQHARLREITTKANLDLVNQYLTKEDWRVNENSNMSFSLQGLNNYVSSEVTKTYWLNSIYPAEVRTAYINGDLHIHDLGCLSVYCVGWDLQDLLTMGFRGATGKVESKPAKHFRTALGQIVNFFYTLQGEAAGAQAFSFDAQTPITIRRNGRIESITMEMLFDDYKHHLSGFNGSEVIYTEGVYRRYLMDDADERKYIDSRMPTEPILFQYDKIEVLSEKGFVPLKAVSRHKAQREDDKLLIIETEDGNVLRVTKSHPMLLADEKMVRADELQIGNELLSSDVSVPLTEEIELNEEFAYLIGFMIAEGCWGHQTREYAIVSQSKNRPERQKVEEIIQKLKIPYHNQGDFNTVFDTTRIGRFIRNYLRLQEKSYRKNLPGFIFDLSKSSIGALLSGLIDGDGDVDRNNIVTIHSTGYTLLMQLKQLLSLLGISSTVRHSSYKNMKENYKDNYVIRFRLTEENRSFLHHSLKLAGVSAKKKDSPVFSSKVVKIVNAKYQNEYVYDITTQNQHFLINNITVHNSNFDTLLAPFIRHDNLRYKEVKQALQEFLFNINVPTRVGFQCLSADTEILTPDGWKGYTGVKKGDEIYTFNLEEGTIEKKCVNHIFAREYEGVMYNLKNRSQDQLVSPRHRIVRKVFNTDRYKLEPIEETIEFMSHLSVPVKGENVNPEFEIDDRQIKLLAWALSEGTIEKDGSYRVGIYQSQTAHPENYEEIIDLLETQELEYTTRIHTSLGTCTHIRLSPTSSKTVHKLLDSKTKKLPSFLFNLSKRQAKLFLDTYIKGDNLEEKFRRKITVTDKETLDGLTAIAVLAGYNFNVKERKAAGISKKLQYVITLSETKHDYIQEIKPLKYKGVIWSVNTENETVIARRNGQVFITGNTPFTNLTLDLTVPSIYRDQPVIINGKVQDTTYKEFQNEMDMLNRAFLEVMLEGDAKGRVFTFPIPTYNITKDFNWDNNNLDLLWQVTAKYGIPYFSNFINSEMKPDDVRSMCCRLRLDTTELRKRGGGLFGANPLTGSIGVVTINMPRIGYLANSENEFFTRLDELMYMAKESLEIKRKVIEKLTDEGLYPYSAFYLRNVKERFGRYWTNHFATIGLIGMNEACLNLLGKNIGTEEGLQFSVKVMKFMRERLVKFQEETGNNYNLEATPAEGTSYRLAKVDKTKYPDIICANEEEYQKGAEPFYTNSSQLPVNYTDDVFESLELQDELQNLYTGGTVVHLFAGEKVDDTEGVKKLVRVICEKFRLPYFTITPTFSVCPEHGYIKGEVHKCDRCNRETEVYSRVVGYLRPVKQWNKGKVEEFKMRKTYTLK